MRLKYKALCPYREDSMLVCHSVMSDSVTPLDPSRLFCSWDFSGKYTGVICHFLLQGIFLTQGPNPCLLHWQTYSLPLSHLGSPSFFPIQGLEIRTQSTQAPAKVHKSTNKQQSANCGEMGFMCIVYTF